MTPHFYYLPGIMSRLESFYFFTELLFYHVNAIHTTHNDLRGSTQISRNVTTILLVIDDIDFGVKK